MGAVIGAALVCCLFPCLCACCYCLCKQSCCKKKTKVLEDDTASHTLSAMNHVTLSGQPSSDIREAMNDTNNTQV